MRIIPSAAIAIFTVSFVAVLRHESAEGPDVTLSTLVRAGAESVILSGNMTVRDSGCRRRSVCDARLLIADVPLLAFC
ncbi:hypothetical protein GCM10022261_08150 [Brevibacterium daeguense]|uniref:Uncharacterized protein n=1 Tax=Brevibacterium daeguense TaxID=909936 RepID=A0ABP8EH44_9MICO